MSSLDFTLGRHEVTLREPFITALRRVEQYPVITFAISDKTGISGVGEAVATPAIVGDSLEEIEKDLAHVITPALREVSTLDQGLMQLAEVRAATSSKAAADVALRNYFANKSGMTLATSLSVTTNQIRTDVTVPVAEPDALAEIISQRLAQGFSSLKVKLKREPLEKNLEVMKVITSVVQGRASLRIDPNQAWDFEYSAAFLRSLVTLGIEIEYLEQPVGRDEIDALSQLQKLKLVPIMADESLFTMDDLEKLLKAKACTWVNVKLLKSGGITPALEIAQRAGDEGLKVSIGSMMEGAGGVHAAALLAAAIAPELTHDLDAAWWHRDSAIGYRDGWLAL
jgi:L-alanine-DL-glutamate epimerase-like enolase superfamily enzyme